MTSPVQIIHGDCFDEMAKLRANSFHAGVTDPPYGIRFMGKAWDGKDITAKTKARRGQRQDPDGYEGPSGGHNSLAAEAGKYDRSPSANKQFELWTQAWAREMFRILKPGAHLVSFASTRTYHRMVCGIEDAGFEVRDQLAWVFGSGFPKGLNLDGEREGWGTALKPAWEPIVLARKPLIGTVRDNVAAHHTGALNINGCRIGNDGGTAGAGAGAGARVFGDGLNGPCGQPVAGLGRWPANLTHDGSEEVLAQFPKSAGQQGDLEGQSRDRVSRGIFGDMPAAREFLARQDVGSAARFFYGAKASAADRELGCEDLQENSAAENVDREPDSASMNSPRAGAGRTSGRRNHHPTVKPVALMRWLCRLVTPPGGRIIDPFLGSGTTGVASVLENFEFTGIELEPDYVPIARARIAEAQGPLFRTV